MPAAVVMGIDPGPVRTAWVLWDGERESIIGSDISQNSEMLMRVDNAAGLGFQVVIEMIASFGMPVGAPVFETCVWIGRFIQVLDAWDKTAERLTRVQIKHHICKTHKAKDSNIRQALIDRLGAPGKKSAPGKTYGITADMWAALAVAVTYYDRAVETERNSERTAETTGGRR